jgi:hypothetical protein
VKEFLGAVPSNDAVTLLGFNDNGIGLTRKTTDPAERIRAVDRLAPWGATALYDVILRGIDMLGRQTGRKALVVFTDGEDQGSHVAIEDVERRLQASDVTLYMIAQDQLAKSDPEFWNFWIGAILVLTVLFARGGILGLIDRLRGR